MKKINVAVIMGGPSVEREVSLRSGEQVIKNLDPKKYNAFPVEITKDFKWLIGEQKLPLLTPWHFGKKHITNGTSENINMQIAEIGKERQYEQMSKMITDVDIAYLALHGNLGEDGSIQGLFETLNFPYTGSGVMASALAMDKVRAKQIYKQWGLQTPASLVYNNTDFEKHNTAIIEEIKNWIGIPCVIKPPLLGSSVGVTLCRDISEVKIALEKCFQYGQVALIEEYIKGVEITCGVLDQVGENTPTALPVTEISYPQETFFDYKVKYTKGAVKEITPARLEEHITEKIQKAAITAHQALGCYGMSRTDMIIRDETPYVLETNTLPGMTQTSLLPQEAAAIGIDYPQLLDKIITLALKKHEIKNQYLDKI